MKYPRMFFLTLACLIPLSMFAAKLEAPVIKEIPMDDSAQEVANLSALDNRSFEDLSKIAFEKENSYEVRWTALQNMSASYPGKAEELLLKAAGESEWYMKNAALMGLQQMNSKRANEVARKLIADPALVVRSMAVNILSQENTPEIRKLFWAELKKKYNFKRNQSLWVRYQILEFLAERPIKSEREKFLELVNEKDKKIQTIAKNGIIRIK